MSIVISKESAIKNLLKGDNVTIPSGFGGIFNCKVVEWINEDKVKVAIDPMHSNDICEMGLERVVGKDSIRIPTIARNIITGREAVAVRSDDGREFIGLWTQGKGHESIISAVDITKAGLVYRDKDAFKKGMAAVIVVRDYIEKNSGYIQKRFPDADSTELDLLIARIDQGAWISPTRFENAIEMAGSRHDLTFWADPEVIGPIKPRMSTHKLCIAAAHSALCRMGAEAQSFDETNYKDSPIKNAGYVDEAVAFSRLYLDERGLADHIEVRTSSTSHHGAAFVLAADLLLVVEKDRWFHEYLRPFSKVNEEWLNEMRSLKVFEFDQGPFFYESKLSDPLESESLESNLKNNSSTPGHA